MPQINGDMPVTGSNVDQLFGSRIELKSNVSSA